MTPEDLTAIGIQNPGHRKRLRMEISRLRIWDGLPEHVPGSLEEWLRLLRLEEYLPRLRQQGYQSLHQVLLNLTFMTVLFLLSQVININIEDLEDAGFYKLGHQKRLVLGVKKLASLLRDQKPAQSKRVESNTREQFSTFHPPPRGLGCEGGKRQTERMARLVATWAAEQERTSPSPPLPPYPDSHPGNLSKQDFQHLAFPPPLPAKSRPVARITGQRPHGWRPHQALAPPSRIPLWNPTSSPTSTLPRSTGISTCGPSKNQEKTDTVLEEDRSQRGPRISLATESSRLRMSRSTGDVLQDIGSMLSDLTRELDSIITADGESNT